MKTVSKALSLLVQFSVNATPKSLGAMATDAGLDKATTRRMLVAMRDFGMIEQDPKTRKYTLGTGILPLARAREALRPVRTVTGQMVRAIADQTGETAHFSVPGQDGLSVLCVAESSKPIRAYVAEGSVLPFHTTGGGIAYLSKCDDTVLDRILSAELPGYAPNSYTDPDRVRDAIAEARSLGYAATNQTFNEQSSGLAVPVMRSDGLIAGVLAVTTPSERMNSRSREKIVGCLMKASAKATSML